MSKLINLWSSYITFDCPTAQKLVLVVPFNHREGEGLIGTHQNSQSMLDFASHLEILQRWHEMFKNCQ